MNWAFQIGWYFWGEEIFYFEQMIGEILGKVIPIKLLTNARKELKGPKTI